MTVSQLSISNLALTRVGHLVITQSELDAGTTRASSLLTLHYTNSRDACLRAHPWNFAVRRTKLITQAESAKTITGATAANPVEITIASHGYSDGDRVRIATVGGMTQINDREFSIDSTGTNTFTLLNEDGTLYTAYTSGGTATKIPAFGFSYWFALPTDALRVLQVDDGLYEFKVEKGRILTDCSAPEVKYLYQATDATTFDAQFVDLLAQMIAAEICTGLTDNAALTERLWNVYQMKLREARGVDALEDTPDNIEADLWTNSRL